MIASWVHHNTTLVPWMVLSLLTGKKLLASQEGVYSRGLSRCNHNGFPIVSYKVIILCDLYHCYFLPLFQSAVSQLILGYNSTHFKKVLEMVSFCSKMCHIEQTQSLHIFCWYNEDAKTHAFM